MTNKHIALIGLLGLASATTVFAADFGKSGNRLVKALELDETQAAAVQEIFATQREELQTQLEAVLTPEQLEKLSTMREGRRDGKRGRRGDQAESDA